MTPRWPKMLPRWPQDGPNTAQDSHKKAQHGPRWPETAQDGPRWPQDNPRWQQLLICWSSDLLSHLASKWDRRQRRSLQIRHTLSSIGQVHRRSKTCLSIGTGSASDLTSLNACVRVVRRINKLKVVMMVVLSSLYLVFACVNCS
jgi:hypothetical protein